MRITQFQADRFRNLKELSLRPDPGINIIYGPNAQGKTNLIEAIWMFSGAKSFRGTKDTRLIAFDADCASLSLSFDDGEREQHAQITMGEKNKILLNRVEYKRLSKLSGIFLATVFSPAHLSVIQGSPSERRRFLDSAIGQIRPDFHSYVSQYERVLSQRNALLKEVARYSYLRDTLEVWDRQLAKLGTIISLLRQDYIVKIAKFAKNNYSGISSHRERLSLSYESTALDEIPDPTYSEDKVQSYFQSLEQNLETDLKQGFTGVGVHRDDLSIQVNGIPVRSYGSQGQQRSCILALKLAEAKLLKTVTGQNPVILLDDVMSELDVSRQDYILNHVREHQVFLTCCDISNTLRLQEGRVFRLEDGRTSH